MEGHYTFYKNIAYNKYRDNEAVSITRKCKTLTNVSKIMIKNKQGGINPSLIINRNWSGTPNTKQINIKNNHELDYTS